MSGLGQYNGKPQFVNFTEQLCQNRGKVYKWGTSFQIVVIFYLKVDILQIHIT
jgi:hypothetical protein